ncbi:SDR family NAD(P)-dependent oxidoreductase [Sedimentitalea nanhaiensis]|uniref:NAD(P)-dependent dehydrogenase, short-chain alcohol dehydrogenase family n=1 Tax=Sedimentitalea nanhaiensis TaxID=999627 RepID=A0A1I7BUU2_9RHOB|nr:SDR family oxidoreductase [Sedimentitalea nanhaiensis]SFT90965.1 NAD(P)-dependent dehydrogenase, short-chain alcohol dehydrogenase family [Sedimentitalea nanhaiensis]
MTRTRPVVAISGIASGIGLATAHRFRCDGWQIIGLDIIAPSETPADEMIEADLANSAGIACAERQLLGRETAAFVHSAGLMRDDSDHETMTDAGLALWTLHVGAAARLAQTLLPNMPNRRGRVVLLSSRAAQGRAGRGLYAASKAALDGLVRSLAAEHAARGITVNAVAPAATQTPQLNDPARKNAAVRSLPIGRTIRAEEVAATIAFLASADAGAITGQTIYQCGGASIAGAGP